MLTDLFEHKVIILVFLNIVLFEYHLEIFLVLDVYGCNYHTLSLVEVVIDRWVLLSIGGITFKASNINLCLL